MPISTCSNCDKEFKYSVQGKKKGKYCSIECTKQGQAKELREKFNRGQIKNRLSLKKHLSEDKGYKCFSCGISEWNSKPITLELNHVDGNAGNNMPSNLEIVCPNCHSQTPTHRAKNKGNGRAARGLSLF